MTSPGSPDSLASTLWGLATFEVFISPTLLIGFYYLGAVGGPLMGLIIMRQLIAAARRTDLPRVDVGEKVREAWTKGAMGMRAMAVLAFVFFELFWRMLFEFLLAYLQMRDALVGLGG